MQGIQNHRGVMAVLTVDILLQTADCKAIMVGVEVLLRRKIWGLGIRPPRIFF